jgi:ABC-2 type transport system ATP-binding protein
MSPTTNYAITTEDVSKIYGKTPVVSGLNLRVPRGAIYGLLGRNGAGKTTTIRMMMSLARPSSGSLSVLGLDPIRDRVAMLARTGYVPDEKFLLAATGEKILAINRGFYPGTWSDKHAAEYIRRFEIPMDTKFSKLSLGSKTKLYLMLAMAQRPEVLVLDEPTTGLDPVMIDQLLRTLVEDFANEGRTVFLSSHQLREIEQICDWVGILHTGKILLEERLDDIRDRYRRVTASGPNLPRTVSDRIVSVQCDGDSNAMDYLVNSQSEEFVARLAAQGATIVDVSPISLTDIFLRLCRPEAA